MSVQVKAHPDQQQGSDHSQHPGIDLGDPQEPDNCIFLMSSVQLLIQRAIRHDIPSPSLKLLLSGVAAPQIII
jgi:hypothetical protein